MRGALGLRAFGVFCLSAMAASCEAPRPNSVPAGAVAINFNGNGGWAYCWLDEQAGVNRCRTYTSQGVLGRRPGRNAEDDVFLPYPSRDKPVPQSELKIDIVNTQWDYVWLENGTVMLPRNDFAFQRQHVERIIEATTKREARER